MKTAILLLFAILVVGCKKSGPTAFDAELTPEQMSAADFIGSFSDDAGTAAFKEKFSTAPSAADLKKYRNLYFSAKEIEVSGDSATVTVDISKPGEQDPMAEKTWKLKKVGEAEMEMLDKSKVMVPVWKVESAPVD